ncbi:MAG: InlB B-repeat-containing protein, partial [Clostridia bacterium]|nr:InlB B-repeat-containing protein [Clostridia bacterium]
VTAVSNNEAWGTVSVDGIKITASPATGYYVSGYEVVSGTATATINGNTITVAPESDCTIRVIFAPKPSYTVSFVASGSSEGSETAFDGDAITLPSSVSVNADGWTFSGWTDEQVPEETTQNPGYLLPGASYTVTGNATLYALYTRVDEGAGEVVYELVSNAPTDWTGNYVITYGTDTSMYVMTGVTPSSNGAQIESASNATTYANAGVSLSGSVLSNVANSYIFKLAKHGNYYSIQSASTNAYIGEDSSSYLAGYTTYASGSCDWTPGTLDNASSATNANNGSYPLLGFSTGSGYFWSGSISSGTSAAKNVRFWRENGGDLTYYTTEPVEAGPAFTTQSLLLEGKIGVRFYVRLPEALRNENTSVSFTISGKGGDACTATVPFSSDLPTNTNGYYGFTYYVGVIQMADTITATLNYTVDGEAQTLEKTYSVKEYFKAFDENYAAHPELYTNENVVELIKATADLGHYVQAYLDEARSEWSVPTDHAAMDKVYANNILNYLDDAATAVASHALAVEGSNTDIKSLGYALVMDSDTTIRVTIVPKSGFTGTITATVDGEAVEVKKISKVKYAVDIPNVQAHELSTKHTIEITTENGTVTLTGSGLSFVKMLLNAYPDNETVQNAAIAIWRYSKFADDVRGVSPEANRK